MADVDTIQFPCELLEVAPWADPIVEKVGMQPASLYAEYFWLPILGPTAFLLLRRVTLELKQNPSGTQIMLHELNNELGLGPRGGKHGPLWRALLRTKHFGLTMLVGHTLYIRTRLPPLNQHQIAKLPGHLQTSHSRWRHLAAEQPAALQRATTSTIGNCLRQKN